jgi:predicted O-methyltransferase YrrM
MTSSHAHAADPQSRWSAVDDYINDTLTSPEEPLTLALASALKANSSAGLPAIDVSAPQGKLLTLYARMCGARSVLEIGTLGGYSTLCLAAGLPPNGRVLSLEADPHHATVARENIANAGLSQRVEVRLGPALDTLPGLTGEDGAPFDLVFIDADKANNPLYLDWAVRLSHPGTVIVCDNVVREGQVADLTNQDGGAVGSRGVLERIASDARLDGTVIQTVGSKGWDGFALITVGA